MDSLQEILGKKDFTPPDEIEAIKNYIFRRYSSRCRIIQQNNSLVLSVPSSALAATLQLDKQKLIKTCNVKKKLVIRTG